MSGDPKSGGWAAAHRQSMTDPDGFWLAAAQAVTWEQAPTVALDASAAPLYR